MPGCHDEQIVEVTKKQTTEDCYIMCFENYDDLTSLQISETIKDIDYINFQHNKKNSKIVTCNLLDITYLPNGPAETSVKIKDYI